MKCLGTRRISGTIIAAIAGASLAAAPPSVRAQDVFLVTTDFSSLGTTNQVGSSALRFSRSGSFLERFAGAPGAVVRSIASHGERLLISDNQSGDVGAYSPDGDFLGAAADLSPQFGQSLQIRIEFDEQGALYAANYDGGGPGAVRLDANGAVTATYAAGGLWHATGVDADAAGQVYISPASGASVHKFDAQGAFLGQYELPGLYGVRDLAIDEAGQRLFVAGSSTIGHATGAVGVYDLSKGAPALITSIPAPGPIAGLSYDDVTGHVFVVDNTFISSPNAAYELALDGTIVNAYLSPYNGLPWDIALGPAGADPHAPEPAGSVLATVGLLGGLAAARRRR